MEKDMIFFSTDGKGLTSTSANHVANMAKEMIRSLTSELNELVFYSTDVALIGEDKISRLVNGTDDDAVSAVTDKLFRIAKAKSLIAWLREAIKAKDNLINEARSMTMAEFAEMEGVTLEDEPEKEADMTEDEYLATLDVKTRCRYYEIETLASTLGKEIHPGGSFADAREDMLRKISSPHSVSGEGRDTLIYTYTSSVAPQNVEDVFFKLQKLYREAQSEVNTLKHQCKKAVTEANIAKDAEHTIRLAEWSDKRKLIMSRRNEYVAKKVKELGEMKITIPESLRETYDEVSRLGKEIEKP